LVQSVQGALGCLRKVLEDCGGEIRADSYGSEVRHTLKSLTRSFLFVSSLYLTGRSSAC
jgi:hypothetical protein